MFQKTLVYDGVTPVGAYAALRGDAGAGSFLLESVEGGERWARYSVLGWRPRRRVVVRGRPGADPFEELARAGSLGARTDDGVAARFARSLIGVVPYDVVHYASKVPPWPAGPEGPVVAHLVGDATVVVFDNLTHTATVAAHARDDLERTVEALARAAAVAPLAAPRADDAPADVELDRSDAEYEAIVERAKEYIRAGDAFQIVPARKFSVDAGRADPFDVYRALRVLSPAPYMYLLELPGQDGLPPVAIAGASPETLVRVDAGRVFLRPIAGTRRRGRTADEDRRLGDEMLDDPKERAEHVMLIDLARNDVGRIAVTGSVEVPVRLRVERYSHVMHIVSEVVGAVRPELGPWDVVRATFPAGTLTGAPKVRAMQILRELEAGPRGVYGGALGYVAPGGDLDLAIAIRTAVLVDGRFEVRAGAGVVADSVPRLEALETRNKARAALAAIAAAKRAAG